MSKSWAWSLSNVDVEVFHAAEEAARRAGLRLEDWLNEAILDKASEMEPPGCRARERSRLPR